MKVLIADKFEQSGIDGLKAAGCEVVYQPDLKDEALASAIRDGNADVLIVRGTPVSAAMLGGGALSLIVRAGAGYNTIDVAAASRRGIYVSNCPGKNSIAVAELTFALILALDRRVPDSTAELRSGHWNKKEYSKARGLFGRTIGLLGYGAIGQEVATRALAVRDARRGVEPPLRGGSRSTQSAGSDCVIARGRRRSCGYPQPSFSACARDKRNRQSFRSRQAETWIVRNQHRAR